MHPTTPGLALLLAATLAAPALAAWPNNPLVNLPVCTVASGQYQPAIVSDGGAPTGGGSGAIVTWYDDRGGSMDVYAQHVLASGAVDPAWPADGRALCTAAGNQYSTAIVSDGAGGAIVTWEDNRGGGSDIYAQHVLASGAVDPAWPADGLALCTAANDQYALRSVPDGAGGAIVAWQDYRSGNSDIYAQRVLASGTVDPAWPADGRAMCTAANDQYNATIVSDGAGSAIVTWQDTRSGTSNDIYAQHVLASGAVDPAWPADGRALCTAANSQSNPTIVPDGAGGAIVTWQDFRSGGSDIYAQHVQASGAVDLAWPADGRALCTVASNKNFPTIATDGAGGAIVTWYDTRSGNSDIYAQHVLSSGAVDPLWPADGRALCTAANNQDFPTIVPDGAGGAIITWLDLRGGTFRDLYAQHVLATGTVDPAWPADGRALSTAAFDQLSPLSVPDGAGGAIVTWQDHRSGNAHIYAQRVEAFGRLGNPEPAIVSVADVPYDDGGHVKLSWTASYLDAAPLSGITNYEIWRSIPPGLAQARLRGGARLLRPGSLPPMGRSEELLATAAGAQTIYWEYVASQPARRFAGYSYDLATTGDSVAAGIPAMQALVLAFSTDGYSYWASAPMSGYSVDNLAPAAPAPLTGQYAGGTTRLHWNPNVESDLAGYRLYRGLDAGFVPDASNFVATLPDTGYADAAGTPAVYKLSAVDVHGNESPVATLLPSGTTGVGDGGSPAIAFAAPSPNPAVTRTTLRFTLPRAGHVRLSIFDLSGRIVRVLADGAHAAGAHVADWDLRDDAGTRVRAGLFFARLEAAGRELRQRVVVAR